MDNTLYIVVPCYNEEEVLPETARRLREKMHALIRAGKIAENSHVVFVNDGSKDRTWELICRIHQADALFSGVNLSRNRGHQNALLAGLMTVRNLADMTISMDADLQDDIDAVDLMVDKYLEGFDIVYGVRDDRQTDSFFKRFTAEGYYKLLAAMGCEIVYNHADFRLMSKRAAAGLSSYHERNLFLRGIVPMIGYRTTSVTYKRGERLAGESKYPLKKMLALAWEGITSLSIRPIRLLTALGGCMVVLSLLFLLFCLVALCLGHTMLNWKIILFSIWFVGGCILLGVGIVGEYVGKVYMEVKARPRYFVETFLHTDKL